LINYGTCYSSKIFVDGIEVVANTPDGADTSQEMADFKIGSRVLLGFTGSLHAYDKCWWSCQGSRFLKAQDFEDQRGGVATGLGWEYGTNFHFLKLFRNVGVKKLTVVSGEIGILLDRDRQEMCHTNQCKDQLGKTSHCWIHPDILGKLGFRLNSRWR
jgi:hypothetical protein